MLAFKLDQLMEQVAEPCHHVEDSQVVSAEALLQVVQVGLVPRLATNVEDRITTLVIVRRKL